MKLILILVLFLSTTTIIYAQERATEIVTLNQNADDGFKHTVVRSKMLLINKQGQTSERIMTTKTFEGLNGADKSLIIFESPRDVKGTSSLSHTNIGGDDDQWLFLPSIKRVKRISSSNKSGPFMGSEFAFEDLSSPDITKYTYELQEESSTIAKVIQYPTSKSSGYSKRIETYNLTEGYRTESIEFYDRKGQLLKTLTFSDYQKYLNKYWKAQKMTMVNHISGKETVIEFSQFDFETILDVNDFTPTSLKRSI